MDESLSHADISSDSGRRRGGWITFPFIIGALGGLTLAAGGWISNLIVFLIEEFNVNSIDAAQISNVVYGSVCFFPIIGAIIADSFFGSFYVISISSCISLLGIVLLVLTATLNSLKPQPCATGSKLCQPTSALQYAVFYTGIAVASLGLGANLIGMAIFFSGSRFYKFDKPQGSPFVGLGRVIVASVRKTSLQLSTERKDYYYGLDGVTNNVAAATLSKSFRFLNRAAQKIEGDVKSDGSIAKPWSLCTTQQVEDFKTVLRIFPLWSTALFLATPIAIQSSMSVLQALTMDRHIGPHFKLPSSSVIVIVLFSTSIFLTLIDRSLCPIWQKFTGQLPSPLQRVGVGHVLTILSMAVSAVMESKRLKIVQEHHLQDQPGTNVPMSIFWLFPQLVLVGIGEAFHFPGQAALFYQEFPMSLRSTSTALISLIIGIAYYVSTGVVNMVQRVTGWLPNNLNNGKLDNVYWMLAVLGVINFGYYLLCAKLYRYQNVKGADGSPDPDS
ncbi:protein NRT1/ PTR FAMILY 2.7-like [Pyrus ussuriensis x Pyrus communis]|uniref:Protein NRT1/ PTR FAMILY 2.7-like n=1 Tax=Pyrus ussuriensis x Pyrus communis TaxID=2448454 RepID=A0A5N5GVR8_9ROSA|nr:protein NRT1/ PTR FAMILY 2.7-like [Pyrus ussuriensis x Pyrus communis]